jgi:hypothetical protein
VVAASRQHEELEVSADPQSGGVPAAQAMVLQSLSAQPASPLAPLAPAPQLQAASSVTAAHAPAAPRSPAVPHHAPASQLASPAAAGSPAARRTTAGVADPLSPAREGGMAEAWQAGSITAPQEDGGGTDYGPLGPLG